MMTPELEEALQKNKENMVRVQQAFLSLLPTVTKATAAFNELAQQLSDIAPLLNEGMLEAEICDDIGDRYDEFIKDRRETEAAAEAAQTKDIELATMRDLAAKHGFKLEDPQ